MLEEDKNNNLSKDEWDLEAEQNWVGFWNLLLEEDIRQNPELYKNKEKKYD